MAPVFLGLSYLFYFQALMGVTALMWPTRKMGRRVLVEGIYATIKIIVVLKPVTLKDPPHENYAYEGAPTLIDGLHGSQNYRTGRWIGFWGTPLEATIDLQQLTEIQKVAFSSIININDWIYNPQSFTVFVSNDGEEFREVAKADYHLADWDHINSIERYELTFAPEKTRYVRVVIM